MTQGRYNYL